MAFCDMIASRSGSAYEVRDGMGGLTLNTVGCGAIVVKAHSRFLTAVPERVTNHACGRGNVYPPLERRTANARCSGGTTCFMGRDAIEGVYGRKSSPLAVVQIGVTGSI